jgi:peroxiredoxin
LQAYQDILSDIKALGANLVAISPQKPEYSLSMAEKHKLGFEVLSDVGNRVARQFGLVFAPEEPLRNLYKEKLGVDLKEFNADESSELPMPGTFIISQDGTIQFAFVDPDYTTRMEPAEIIKRLREIGR